MRVFAVAQHLGAFQGHTAVRRPGCSGFGAVTELRSRPLGHGCVVRSGMGERFGSQAASFVEVKPAGSGSCGDSGVLGRIHHNGDGGVILGGSADHGRSADVDLLDDVVLRCAGLHGLDERVEVHDHEVEGFDAELFELVPVVLAAAVGQDAGVHARVERLHAAVQAFLEAGDFGYLGDLNACSGDLLGGGAGGDNADAGGGEALSQFRQAGLVIDRDEGPADRYTVKGGVAHGSHSNWVSANDARGPSAGPRLSLCLGPSGHRPAGNTHRQGRHPFDAAAFWCAWPRGTFGNITRSGSRAASSVVEFAQLVHL